MPTFEFICEECKYEFEDFYQSCDPLPTTCPKCNVDGKVKRLISGGSGKGIVVLDAREEKAKIKNDIKEMKHRVRTDEKYRENLFGKG